MPRCKALSGKKLGIRAIIVMPKTTPDIKVQAVKRLGGEVVLHGDSFDVANKIRNSTCRRRRYEFYSTL